MRIVNVGQAMTHLSRLIDLAAGGEDIVIARNGRPVARVTRLVEERVPIRFGVLKGKFSMREDLTGHYRQKCSANSRAADPLTSGSVSAHVEGAG